MTICIIIFERLYYFFSIVEQHQYASHKKKVTVVLCTMHTLSLLVMFENKLFG